MNATTLAIRVKQCTKLLSCNDLTDLERIDLQLVDLHWKIYSHLCSKWGEKYSFCGRAPACCGGWPQYHLVPPLVVRPPPHSGEGWRPSDTHLGMWRGMQHKARGNEGREVTTLEKEWICIALSVWRLHGSTSSEGVYTFASISLNKNCVWAL